MGKVLLFDFDGVLADSFDNVYLINSLAAKSVSRELTRGDYLGFFDRRFHEELANFLKLDAEGLNAFKAFKDGIYDEKYSSSRLFDFVPDMIGELSGNCVMHIITSAKKKSVENLLGKYGVLEKFKSVQAVGKEGKTGLIEKFRVDCPGQEVFFITDTAGDLLDARKAGVKTIAVTWGFHDKKKLEDVHPDYVVEDHAGLIKIANEVR